VPKKMMTDEHGYYRLFSAGPKIHDSIGQKHRFRVDGPFLLFRSKLDLFAFLISDDAAGIDHLQFYEEKIKDLLKTNEDEYDENKHEAVVEPTKNFENAHEFNLNITKESKSESENLRERNFDLKDTKLKAATCEEVALRNELSKVDMAVHDTCSNKSSEVETVKVPDEDKKHEVEGILELNNNDVKISKEEAILPRTLLDQKDEEIRSLKKKLLLKERMIQTEIIEKNAAKVSLGKALSQLGEINQLSKFNK